MTGLTSLEDFLFYPVVSSFYYRHLPSWLLDRDRALDVSATSECDANVMATRCGLDGNEVAYFPDVPLVVRRAVPVRFGEISFFALIAEPKDKSLSPSLVGTDLVMATWPVSRGWYDHGKFQFGFKHKVPDPGPEVMEALQKQSGAKRALLRQLGRNPFDTRHQVVTAILCDPYPLDPLKKFILGRQFYYGARGDEPQSLMAICENYSELRQRLFSDPLLVDMMNATFDTRDLLPRYHRSFLERIASSPGSAGWYPGRESSEYMIFDEIASSELAETIMMAAIDLALAGPESYESFRENLDSEKKGDGRKLVKHRARDIYLQFYWNLWKRMARVRRETAGSHVLSRKKDSPEVPLQEQEFWGAVSEVTANLEASPDGVETTAATVIKEFIEDDGVPGLLHGPQRENDPLKTEALYENKKATLLFLIQAAAILDTGYCPKDLPTLLDELHETATGEVFQVIDWIKNRFPLE